MSSKSDYQAGNNRANKELFGNLMKIENPEEHPYYACESKITLSIDDLFD